MDSSREMLGYLRASAGTADDECDRERSRTHHRDHSSPLFTDPNLLVAVVIFWANQAHFDDPGPASADYFTAYCEHRNLLALQYAIQLSAVDLDGNPVTN